jgi:hypothetical protein
MADTLLPLVLFKEDVLMKKALPVFCLVAVLFAVPIYAQVAEEMTAVGETMAKERRALLEREMTLTDKEAGPFWELYEQFTNDRREVVDRWIKLIYRYEQSFDSITEVEAETMLDEKVAIEMDGLKLRKQYIKEFRKILSAKNTLRFFQINNKVDDIILFDLAGKIPVMKP